MSQYYDTRLTAAPNASVNPAPGDAPTLSEFDKHRETLLSDDAEDGWASELRRYLATMQRHVKKDTDIVEWWQVSIFNIKARYLCSKLYRTMLCCTRHLHALPLTSFRLRRHLFFVNGCSQGPNKLRLTDDHGWMRNRLRNSPL